MAKRKKTDKKPFRRRKRPARALKRWGRRLGGVLLLAGLALASLYVLRLDHLIRQQFEGRRWDIPARVYARPLELYPGLALTPEALTAELELAGYRQDARASLPGSYDRSGPLFHIVTRPFVFGDGQEPARSLLISFGADQVVGLRETGSDRSLALARLDPAQIGSFHPLHHEDRVLVRRQDIPELLVKALLAVEDRNFYEHHGIDPRGIARALWTNLRAGSTVQGGSTLTQQLVKNYFLNNERTLRRKLNEAIMALLLELHYDKEEILTAYANEVFLGQDGSRAVHGFGLASQFYFRRQLGDLELDQLALLAGLVKGPSYYDPRRHPERAKARRDLVLAAMADQGFISQTRKRSAMGRPLDEKRLASGGSTPFPAFLEAVRQQLQQEYREEDLVSEGLRIFTTLDPQVQWQAERALQETAAALEKKKGQQDIQGAVVVTQTGSGEVQAIVGSRHPGSPGFNRALRAVRPIGSLVKPAVYLTALENGYTLASLVEDRPLDVDDGRGGTWRPANFDRRPHGRVSLAQALANSYNLATVRLGLELGVDEVAETLQRLGVERQVSTYPSLLLGAVSLSPYEVSQFYLTLAANGFYSPQRVIRQVLDSSGRPLQRYELSVEQRVDSLRIYLLTSALQQVVRQGTGRSLARYLPPEYGVAGKTGSSDGLRDSWFAGFTGDRLAVVWLGQDDNTPLGLTGSGGALVVWGKLMASLRITPLELVEPPEIEWAWVDPQTRTVVSKGAPRAEYLPLIKGSGPMVSAARQQARQPSGAGATGWLRRFFGGIF